MDSLLDKIDKLSEAVRAGSDRNILIISTDIQVTALKLAQEYALHQEARRKLETIAELAVGVRSRKSLRDKESFINAMLDLYSDVIFILEKARKEQESLGA